MTIDIDPLSPFEKFESLEDAIAEDAYRARQLARVIKRSEPADKSFWQRRNGPIVPSEGVAFDALILYSLQKELEKDEPQTLASSRTMRKIRLRYMMCAAALANTYAAKRFKTFTLLNDNWYLAPHEFSNRRVRNIFNTMKTNLNRAKVTEMQGPIVLGLDGDFEATSQRFVLHFHGFGQADKVDALEALKDLPGYIKTRTNAPWLKKPYLKTPAEFDWSTTSGSAEFAKQISYTLKSFWRQRSMMLGEDGKWRRQRGGDRIEDRCHVQHLLWLHMARLKNLTLTNQVWSPRNKGTEAGRNLYLLFQNPYR